MAAAKEAWSDPDLEAQLAQLLPLGHAIEIQSKLEGHFPLQESLSLLKQFRESVAGTAAEWKISGLIHKNTGVQLLSEQPCTFRNAPLVTCDVERFFSRMKQAQKSKPNATMETIHKFLLMASSLRNKCCFLVWLF